MTTETQYIQYGVRCLDGTGTTAKTRNAALRLVGELNYKARQLGLPETAHVLKRHVRTVHYTKPWERDS